MSISPEKKAVTSVASDSQIEAIFKNLLLVYQDRQKLQMDDGMLSDDNFYRLVRGLSDQAALLGVLLTEYVNLPCDFESDESPQWASSDRSYRAVILSTSVACVVQIRLSGNVKVLPRRRPS